MELHGLYVRPGAARHALGRAGVSGKGKAPRGRELNIDRAVYLADDGTKK